MVLGIKGGKTGLADMDMADKGKPGGKLCGVLPVFNHGSQIEIYPETRGIFPCFQNAAFLPGAVFVQALERTASACIFKNRLYQLAGLGGGVDEICMVEGRDRKSVV